MLFFESTVYIFIAKQIFNEEFPRIRAILSSRTGTGWFTVFSTAFSHFPFHHRHRMFTAGHSKAEQENPISHSAGASVLQRDATGTNAGF